MKLQNEDRLLIRRYLLGRLPEDERAQVEDRLMTDRTYLNQVEYAEEILREDYVHGRLSVEDRKDFEASLATDSDRRRDVEFTKALRWYARTREEEAGEVRREKPWRTAHIFTGFIKPAPTSGQQAHPHRVSLSLMPGLVRGEGVTSSTVLPAHTNELRLELIVEKGKDFQAYRAELRTVEGEVISEQEHLRIPQSGAGRSLPVTIPAASLSENDYILTLLGTSEGRVYEKVGTYHFALREEE